MNEHSDVVDKWNATDGSIDELIANVTGPNGDGENLRARLGHIKVQQEQIRTAKHANELSQALIESNQRAAEQNEASATQMYDATVQLAKSTRSLKLATWALVGFTAVQAIIALAALYISIHSGK